MSEKLPYLDKYEKERLNMCLNNIHDKLTAIDVEALKNNSYKYYIKEKIDSILWDANVIKNLTEE